LYDMGLGTERDFGQAAHWFALAAAQGNADGEFDLGMSYLHGEGVEQDYTLARECSSSALHHGDGGRSASGIAMTYEHGAHADYARKLLAGTGRQRTSATARVSTAFVEYLLKDWVVRLTIQRPSSGVPIWPRPVMSGANTEWDAFTKMKLSLQSILLRRPSGTRSQPNSGTLLRNLDWVFSIRKAKELNET
jgi:hypothetical protein